MSIAPKARQQQTLKSAAPSNESSTISSQEAASHPKPPSCRLLLRVFPISLLRVSLPEPPDEQTIAYVSANMLAELVYERKLPALDKAYNATVRRLLPPQDPEESAVDAPVSPTTKVLNPGSRGDAGKVPQEKKDVWDVVLQNSSEVPFGQIVFVGGLDGVQDWDLVR